MNETVDVIILASGFSRRFGPENKLLRRFQGKTFVEITVDLALSVQEGGETIVVYSDPDVAAAVKEFPGQRVHNKHPERGIGESVGLGVRAAKADYYLFLHCDQPLLDRATVQMILSQRRHGKIVVPYHGENPGTPALFSSRFRAELLALSDGQSPRLLKERHPDDVVAVSIESPWPLLDVDTESDFACLEVIHNNARDDDKAASGGRNS